MFRHMEDKQPVTNTSGRLRWRDISGPLFRKYVALFLAVVCVALVTNVAFQVWFSYAEHKTALIRIQREQAEAAATKIGQFIKEIESQLGWTTQLPWSPNTLEQRRFDALRLLRQCPPSPNCRSSTRRAARSSGSRGSPWM
jgi:two-component system NtrC family sensor kinase